MCKKVLYPSIERARFAIVRIKTKGVKDIRVYFCNACNGFHIGHKKSDMNFYDNEIRKLP